MIIAGAGKDLENVKELFKDFKNIRFTGRISEVEKETLFKESKVLIMPSRYEGWGMVSLEAMAYGTPVLASNIPGLNEAVGEENKVRLIDFDNVNYWVKSLKEIVSDREKWNQISEVQIKRAQKFSWQSVALKHEALYKKLILEKN